jgi:hypothetical protein
MRVGNSVYSFRKENIIVGICVTHWLCVACRKIFSFRAFHAAFGSVEPIDDRPDDYQYNQRKSVRLVLRPNS